jgi:hypothetical protein
LFELLGNEILEDLQDRHEMALAYWRQNHRQYPPEWIWDKFYFDLLHKSFESRHEVQAWCVARVKQLRDPVYHEEQHQQQMKAKEEKRLAREVEQQMRHETPDTWKYHIATAKENSQCHRAAERVGMIS